MADQIFEVTLRFVQRDTFADPAVWSWEEVLDSPVEVISTEEVGRFKSDDFQRVYEETQDDTSN